jgi:hypothetical protein
MMHEVFDENAVKDTLQYKKVKVANVKSNHIQHNNDEDEES